MINNNNTAPLTDVPGTYLGNYLLLRLLGYGGFASVYLGEHRYLKSLAAIKVLTTMLTEQEKEPFLEEARLLARLSHPHIVRVLEFDIAQRRIFIQNATVIEHIPFLVMEYIPGGNLRTLYPMGTRLFLHTIIPYIKQTAAALSYAHAQGIIHRDVKPENLLLAEQQIMLSDFGLALFTPQPDLMSRKSMAGTVPYSAPEQLKGKPTFASDQYSLAIIAYEWLCGHPPFMGTDAEIMMQHISSPPPPLQDANVSIHPQVQAVILKALAKNPAQRFATVLEFALTLEEASQQQHTHTINPLPTTAHPSPNAVPTFYYLSHDPTSTRVDENATVPLKQLDTSVAASPTLRNRRRMLQRVRAMWIEGVLETSFYSSSLITPELSEKQDAVATFWPSPRHQSQKKTVAHSLSITQAYDEAGGDLLILGEAGSGKTTFLLQLARRLLTRAEHNDSSPIPVIFLLCSWTTKQLPIEQWLYEELNDKYQVPRLLAEQWLASETLLPLLDGLDEVPPQVRSSCIMAINTYKQEHGLRPLVVCSRLTEYLLFPPRILLQRAIVVQPLKIEQVETFFKKAGTNFAAIYQLLRGDLRLYGLITTPLMLHIITLAYKNKSSVDLLRLDSSTQRYHSILATYVEQMLQRHPLENTPQQLTDHLTSLAKNMLQQGNSFFYIEHLQPAWIPTNSWREVYRWLAVLLPGIVIGALPGLLFTILFNQGNLTLLQQNTVYGMIMGCLLSNKQPTALSARPSPSSPTPSSLVKGVSLQIALFVSLTTLLWVGTHQGWIAGLICGLLLGTLSLPIQKLLQRPNRSPHPMRNPQPDRLLNRLFPTEHLKNSLPIGLACGFTSIIALLLNATAPTNTLTDFFTFSLNSCLLNIVLATLLSLLLKNNTGLISCADIVSWSWKRFFSAFNIIDVFLNLFLGVIIGIIVGSNQLFQGNLSTVVTSALGSAMLITISIRLVTAIFQGLASNKLSDHYRRVPNEGMKRSVFHGSVSFALGLVIFAGVALIISILSLLSISGPAALANLSSLQSSLSRGLMNALLLAPAGGLLLALTFGWLASWQHAILRLILRITHVLPLKLSPFLNDATKSVLLRRVGGGYLFVHRTLLEYFASHDPAPHRSPSQSSKEDEPLVRLL